MSQSRRLNLVVVLLVIVGMVFNTVPIVQASGVVAESTSKTMAGQIPSFSPDFERDLANLSVRHSEKVQGIIRALATLSHLQRASEEPLSV